MAFKDDYHYHPPKVSQPLDHSNESPAEGQIRLRIPIAREIIVLRTPGQANEALVGESAYQSARRDRYTNVLGARLVQS